MTYEISRWPGLGGFRGFRVQGLSGLSVLRLEKFPCSSVDHAWRQGKSDEEIQDPVLMKLTAQHGSNAGSMLKNTSQPQELLKDKGLPNTGNRPALRKGAGLGFRV